MTELVKHMPCRMRTWVQSPELKLKSEAFRHVPILSVWGRRKKMGSWDLTASDSSLLLKPPAQSQKTRWLVPEEQHLSCYLCMYMHSTHSCVTRVHPNAHIYEILTAWKCSVFLFTYPVKQLIQYTFNIHNKWSKINKKQKAIQCCHSSTDKWPCSDPQLPVRSTGQSFPTLYIISASSFLWLNIPSVGLEGGTA